MKIPRYWARATSASEHPFHVSVWGWSDESHADAARVARERLVLAEARARNGTLDHKYPYGRGPNREEILREISGLGGAVEGIVTRNSMGCVVLNAERAMFMDIDVPEPTVGDKLRGMFGKKIDPAAAKLDTLKAILSRVPFASCRVYRTAGGLRVLATTPTFTPGSGDVESLMESAGVDPAYRQLCRIQQSFRARLSPKPWRCGMRRVPGQHPREDAHQKVEFAKWLTEYDQKCGAFATCRFLETIGNGSVHDDVATLLRVHDAETKATSGLPLA